MSQVWLLWQADDEESMVLGVFRVQWLALRARVVLGLQYQALTEEARARAGPHQLRQQPFTWEAFQQAHPIEAMELDCVTMPYAPVVTTPD